MPLRLKSDEELMALISRHDERALQELMRRYQRRLGRFSLGIIGSRDLAEEAVANVVLNIWRTREKLAIRSTVRGYLFAAVGNQTLRLRRETKLRRTVRVDGEIGRHLVDLRGSDSDLLYQEFHDEIDLLISKLPPQRQLIFRMNRIEGLRYREIAEALSLSERTVQNQMLKAVAQLGAELPALRGRLAHHPRAKVGQHL
jgi:RNA polymerase sigma factor (sigma-70 family)